MAVLLSETGLKEAYYLPATSIKDWGAVEKSDLRTACPYKGEAWYVVSSSMLRICSYLKYANMPALEKVLQPHGKRKEI